MRKSLLMKINVEVFEDDTFVLHLIPKEGIHLGGRECWCCPLPTEKHSIKFENDTIESLFCGMFTHTNYKPNWG